MPQSFECPNCGGSLPIGKSSGVVTCRYCGSAIRTDDLKGDGGRGDLPPEAGDEIRELLRNGDRIGAIKVYRRHMQGTLKESKEAVEGMAGDMGLAVRSGSCSALLALAALTAGTLLAVLLT
ncbi:MAG: hypothetical protein JXA64_04595 [Candidatus Fermentibacteraceae bacterium]|nr:hypothetical protein [Candidatus Fermentibacteraceae bacterium]